jgi:hypothetical protein
VAFVCNTRKCEAGERVEGGVVGDMQATCKLDLPS